MVDYQTLYKILFNEITNAIEDMDNKNCGLAKGGLINIQQEVEDIYISVEE